MSLRRRVAALLLLLPFSAWGEQPRPVVYRNTSPNVTYVGSESCARAGCHEELSKTYKNTPMGNSMAPANSPSELARVPKLILVVNRKLDRNFEVFRQGSDLYQTEYAADPHGKAIFQQTERLEYVIGGPLTGYTYVIRRGRHLFQAPLSFYDKTQEWDLSPGYSARDVGFTRPITEGCLACHNGQPLGVPNRDGMYQEPPFRFGECAISCEACHGAGQMHVQELARKPGHHSRQVDTSIVNPARLPPRLANDICMNCHQGGHTRVLQPGKDYMDFRPGTALYETVAIFKVPLRPEQRAEANRLETLPPVRGSLATPLWWKNSSLEMSRCYEESHGQLRCITCHVIHQQPNNDKVAYYRERCLTCHTNESCKLSLSGRMQHVPANDCVGCHMPKSPVAGIPHSDDTSHRIVRRAGQELPESAFRQATLDSPGLLCVNKPEGKENEPVPLLTMFRAYGETMARDPSMEKYYNEALEQLAKSAPGEPLVLGALGQRALAEKDYSRATDYLSRALAAGQEYPLTYVYLGQALSEDGRLQEAAQVLERGTVIWPYAAQIQKSLILNCIKLKDYKGAEDLMRSYLELFPEDSVIRDMLKKAEAESPQSGALE